MHHKHLREIAKFGSGLIAADFLTNAWFAAMGYYPIEFLGWTFTSDIVLPALIFDAALFLILVHYGWQIGKIPALRERTYLLIAGIVFGIVALAHLMRLFFGSNLNVAGWSIPLWLSWFGVVLATYLCYMSLIFAARMKKH